MLDDAHSAITPASSLDLSVAEASTVLDANQLVFGDIDIDRDFGGQLVRGVKKELGRNEQVKDALYQKYYSQNLGPVIKDGSREIIMMGAVNYLGLSHHPKVIDASIQAIMNHGASGLGSRYSNGCLMIHKQLDEEMKSFLGLEDCVFFNSGYLANLGAFTAFGKDAVVFSDKENHLSIYDACRLSGLKYFRFKHNNPEHLESLLKNACSARNKWVVLVGTFGATGENIRLKEIVRVAKKYGSSIYLDDAHTIGIVGENFRGLADKYNILSEIDLLMTSFQMAFGNTGAVIAGKNELINRMRYNCRPYMFTFTLQPNTVAGILAALDIVKSETGSSLRRNLSRNVLNLRHRFKAAGFEIISDDSEIISVRIGLEENTVQLAEDLHKQGVWVQKYVHPSVPIRQSIVRFTCMATHTEEHIDKVASIFINTGKACHLV